MPNEDDLYKREEDRKWRESVEARLVSLTSAQKTTDDDLDKHETRLEELEQLLEGDPLKRDDSGLKGDVLNQGVALNALRAIMAPDQLGQGGVKHRLESVESALGLREATSNNRWKVILATISATAIITSAIVANLDKIAVVWHHAQGKKVETRSSTKKRATKRRSKAVPLSVDEEPNESSGETMPEVR